MISGQISYFSNELFWRNDEESHAAAKRSGYNYNIGLNLFPRMLAIFVMVTASMIVATKLLMTSKLSTSSSSSKKLQVSVTLLILASIYFITFIPFCIITIIDVAQPTFTKKEYYRKVMFYLAPVVYLVAFVSSAVNPLVYHLRGKSIFEESSRQRGVSRANLSYANTRATLVSGSEVRELTKM